MPVAVTVALLVATIKGSLVACYFMHLISEKKLIYAVLALTVVFFMALLALPVFTHSNGYWILNEPQDGPRAADPPLRGPGGAVWGLVPGRVRAGARDREPARCRRGLCRVVGLVVYDSWFLRKTRTLR